MKLSIVPEHSPLGSLPKAGQVQVLGIASLESMVRLTL